MSALFNIPLPVCVDVCTVYDTNTGLCRCLQYSLYHCKFMQMSALFMIPLQVYVVSKETYQWPCYHPGTWTWEGVSHPHRRDQGKGLHQRLHWKHSPPAWVPHWLIYVTTYESDPGENLHQWQAHQWGEVLLLLLGSLQEFWGFCGKKLLAVYMSNHCD